MEYYFNYIWLYASYRSPWGMDYKVPLAMTIPGFSFAQGEMGTMDQEGNIRIELQIADGIQGDQKIRLGSILHFDPNKKLQKIKPPDSSEERCLIS
jgi:hypothetical protein